MRPSSSRSANILKTLAAAAASEMPSIMAAAAPGAGQPPPDSTSAGSPVKMTSGRMRGLVSAM